MHVLSLILLEGWASAALKLHGVVLKLRRRLYHGTELKRTVAPGEDPNIRIGFGHLIRIHVIYIPKVFVEEG